MSSGAVGVGTAAIANTATNPTDALAITNFQNLCRLDDLFGRVIVNSPSITLNAYGHLFSNTDDRAAQLIEKTFSSSTD